MTQEQIIAQLKSLKSDAESHREKDGTIDKVYADDIEALSTAIDLVKSAGTRAFKEFKLDRLCEKKAASVKPKRNTCIYCGMIISRHITVCDRCSKKLPIVRRLIAAGDEIKRICGVKEWDSKKRSEISRNEPREQ